MRSNKDYEEAIFHAIKGSSRPGHKYISRTMKNGKWRYTYAKNAHGIPIKKEHETLITKPGGNYFGESTTYTYKDGATRTERKPVLTKDDELFEGYKNGQVPKEYIEELSSNGGMEGYSYDQAKRRLDAIDAQKKRQARRQEAIRSKKTAELKAKGRKFIEDAKRAGII